MTDKGPYKYSDADLRRTRSRIIQDIIDEMIERRSDTSYSGCDRVCFIRIARELENIGGPNDHDKIHDTWNLYEAREKAWFLDTVNPNQFDNEQQ